jgi:hypothetical protein
MSNTEVGSVDVDFPKHLSTLPDDLIRSPLWKWAPEERLAVVHERRRRFGVDDDEGYGNG